MSIAASFWQRPHFIAYWVPPLLWSLAVLCMSGDWGSSKNTFGLLQWLLSWVVELKPAQINKINFYLRKTGHVVSYGLMYFLWFRAFRVHAAYGPRRALIWSLGAVLLFSSMDEGRQWFYPSRGASLRDVILDMSGAGLAALITAAGWTPRSPAPVIDGMAEGGRPGPE